MAEFRKKFIFWKACACNDRCYRTARGIRFFTVSLVGTCVEKIVSRASSLINNKESYNRVPQAHNPHVDGYAREKIVDFFIKIFKEDKAHLMQI